MPQVNRNADYSPKKHLQRNILVASAVLLLLAIKKMDGTVEWGNFVQRDDGRKEKVYHSTVENVALLADVVSAINNALYTAYGPAVSLITADADVYSLDGKKAPPAIH